MEPPAPARVLVNHEVRALRLMSRVRSASGDDCRKAADCLKQVRIILGPRPQA